MATFRQEKAAATEYMCAAMPENDPRKRSARGLLFDSAAGMPIPGGEREFGNRVTLKAHRP